MPWQTVEILASVFTAVGTVAVAILAIWGDPVRDLFLGPRLKLSVASPGGDLTKRTLGASVYYYHVKIKNGRRRNAATGVRVVVKGVAKRTPSGTFIEEPLVYPLQLAWAPREPGEIERTVVDESVCDFGYIGEQDQRFQLALILRPNNFEGDVKKGECLRFELAASGQNVFSFQSSVFEVAWDGAWIFNKEEMQRHLLIREVSSLT
jgi:hypothetical protein